MTTSLENTNEVDEATEIHLGHNDIAEGTYVVKLKNSTLQQLVELVRLQHEAMKHGPIFGEGEDAITAFERFENNEVGRMKGEG